AHPPRFKCKGRCRDSFYVANDKFRIDGKAAVLPKVGRVGLAEALRLTGKIMGASVAREADWRCLAVQVEVPEHLARRRSGDGVVGVDLGITAAATLSTGEKVQAPRPLKGALRRLRLRGRRQSRKLEAAKRAAGISGPLPRGTRLPVSKNRTKGARSLARLHARIARIRNDFTHKLTNRLCRENQAVAIEDLNVKGMLANSCLARAIADIGFYQVRRQLHYKAQRYGTAGACAGGAGRPLVPVEQAVFGVRREERHARPGHARVDRRRLRRLPRPPHQRCYQLNTARYRRPCGAPCATRGEPGGNACTAAEDVSAGGGKVTPARHEPGQQDGSGEEENAAHLCARF
ncbi:MAG: putative transposase, partial [Massilia sp.]